MSITINQIQSLLNTYHRQQANNRLSEARARRLNDNKELHEDKVLISAEAKRLQVYQKTAEEVLKRLRADSTKGEGLWDPVTEKSDGDDPAIRGDEKDEA